MTKLHIGIIEDELLIAEEIYLTLQQIGYSPLRPAYNFNDGLAMIKAEQPDLLLIDISLNDTKDGIQLAAEVNNNFNIPFIFLTGNTDAETIERAKAVKPAAYLIKPFVQSDLFSSIEIAFSNFISQQTEKVPAQSVATALSDSIFIREAGIYHKIKLKDILYVESENVYLNIYTREKCHVSRMKIEDFLSDYAHGNLFRTHRSFAINLQELDTITTTHVVIAGKEVPVSRAYKDALMEKLNTLN